MERIKKLNLMKISKNIENLCLLGALIPWGLFFMSKNNIKITLFMFFLQIFFFICWTIIKKINFQR
jgi:hypothetical protein